MSAAAPPLSVSWELTRACNLACAHCGSAAGFAREQELDPAEALALCAQLDAFPGAHVALTGGEPLLRPDFDAVAAELLRRRGALGLQSNGWLLDRARVERLSTLAGEHGRLHVGLSLDGDEAAHDQLRRAGSYARVVQALRLLARAGIPAGLITTVHPGNLEQLDHVAQVALRSRCYAWQIQVCTAYGRAAVENGLILDPAQYRAVAERVASLRSALAPRGLEVLAADCLGYMGALEPKLRSQPWDGCHAGVRGLGIRANGDVVGCLFLLDPRFVEGNVRRRSLAELWRDPGAFAYNRAFDPTQLQGPCASCAHGPTCRAGCHATGFARWGHLGQAAYCLSEDLPG